MQALTEGPYRSKQTFANSLESTEPMCLNRLRRVREPVSRSKTGVQGKVTDVFGERSRHAESLNELQAFRVLLATARADAWQEQPFILEYHAEGEKHRYTPDLLVVWGARREVVEIKTDTEADLPENRARFALIRELLTEHGYHTSGFGRDPKSARNRASPMSALSCVIAHLKSRPQTAKGSGVRFPRPPRSACTLSAKRPESPCRASFVWFSRACCISTGGNHCR